MPAELLAALRSLLQTKSPDEITLREIAEQADTSQEMVRYYFGSKSRLMMAMMQQSVSRMEARLKAMDCSIAQQDGDPTRIILAALLDLFLSEQESTRISIAEFGKAKSEVRDAFLSRHSGLIIDHIHRTVCSLVTTGVYGAATDTRKTAICMMVLAGGLVKQLPILAPDWLSEEALHGEAWADYLIALFAPAHHR
ncbi:TetR/AcrR family transcriptional regulator [Novosphingobium rosa]|uniref:TetR/AcrR family transcriptional regulator n=1 Tax=Novosphingobium rosa TaxID=76978 RepID=UPI001471E2D2|nr:TetR/AcrR family transcriptional regulator [Novosphingobium rosa]